MKVTILGCGSSAGVPHPNGDWGTCNPENKKNYRRRPSLFIQKGETSLLIDTGADLREQLLRTKITKLDYLVYTHEHSDHTNGIDDLRFLVHDQKKRIQCFGMERTLDNLKNRFSYIFEGVTGKVNYPPLLDVAVLPPQRQLGEINLLSFEQPHGSITSLGLRVDNFAYCTDVSELTEENKEKLYGLECLVVGCVRFKPHPSHAHLERVLEWVDELQPKQTYLTHMSNHFDYEDALAACPKGVSPAHDFLEITL